MKNLRVGKVIYDELKKEHKEGELLVLQYLNDMIDDKKPELGHKLEKIADSKDGETEEEFKKRAMKECFLNSRHYTAHISHTPISYLESLFIYSVGSANAEPLYDENCLAKLKSLEAVNKEIHNITYEELHRQFTI